MKLSYKEIYDEGHLDGYKLGMLQGLLIGASVVFIFGVIFLMVRNY